MKLHTSRGAVSPARVQFFLAEKGIEIECAQVNLMKGEHKTPEYRAISPNGRSPALQLDDGRVICETSAICRYIEALQPEPPLCGTTPVERAHIEMCDRMMEFELMMPMAMTFRHTFPAMKALEDQVPEFGEKQRGVARKRAVRLDKQLVTQDYIAGSEFSIADITAWCSFRFFRVAGFEITDETPHLKAWFARIKARPAAAVAFS
ncbi:glutathione S-transferase family protein [Sinimarinibacterium flocculans]|uniref:Glutathione S-transferase n=1 Tax=Sinimarinibacterium flocculans TaxID=985250 RepID=A0A318EI06_9GAMM|nr:glutathione S-transferase family protein [Sinimarinibacterium flocculans]PXV70256.1 glutathione S-transferase [Sinimarinibacterium flocculans]